MKNSQTIVCALLLICGRIALAESTTQPSTQPATRPAVKLLSDLSKPTTVTFSLKDASPKSAFDELEKQSKFKIAVVPQDLLSNSNVKINLEANNMPWTQALMLLCDQMSLTPQNYNDRWTLTQGGDRRMRGVRSFSGPSMVILSDVTIDKEVRYANPPVKTTRMTLSGMMTVEPQVDLQLTGAVYGLKVTDDQGRLLIEPDATNAPPPVPAQGTLYRGNNRTFSFGTALPDDLSQKLSRIEGYLVANMSTGRAKLEIPDLLNNTGQSVKVLNSTFTIEDVQAMQNYSLVKIRIDNKHGDFDGLRMSQMRTNPTDLPQQTNKKVNATIRVNNIASVGQDGLDLQLTLMVQIPNQNQRQNKNDEKEEEDDASYPVVDLKWDMPTNYELFLIPFDFKDIPLPK